MLLVVGDHDDWPTLGWRIVDFIERYCCHGPGDVQGDPLELDDEEVRLVLDLYRVYPKGHAREGRRVVSRGIYSRAKGRRKSELAGALVVAEARGPVRFSGWSKGDPAARPVTAPFIRCLATEESQSTNTYGNTVAMLEYASRRFPEVFGDVDFGQKVQGSTRIFLAGGGEIRPSTASSAAKDGGKESFAVADETHLYVMPELRGMHRTVSRNLMKRMQAEPWLLETTTSYRPGMNSVAETGHQHAQAVIEKRATAAGLYLNHRAGEAPKDWDDDDQVMAMLVEAYGDAASWMDLERILTDEIRNPEADAPDSKRYFGNIVSQSGEDAFDSANWQKPVERGGLVSELVIPDGELIVLGFDGARFHDATALVATDVITGHQWSMGIWERPYDGGKDWEVPEAKVTAAVEEAFDRFDVWRLYGDPPYWENTISGWAGKYGDKRVISWWTNQDRRMCFAVQAYVSAQRSSELTNDGNPVMARHIANARRRPTRVRDDRGRYMWTLRKENPDSPKKIDAAVGGVISWEARRDAITAGAKKRKRSFKAAGF